MSINIRFPFKDTNRGGVFDVNKTTPNALKDDLISLLTTKRGQRPMRSRLFSPIYDYIMEPMDEISKKELQIDIEEKVQEFIPQITITKINYSEDFENNILTIEIVFRIDTSFGIEEKVILNVPRSNDATGPNGELIIN
jgi:phage baseplate assembly protein W